MKTGAILVSTLALMLGGCAAIVSGSHQEVTVNTTPAGADCSLDRDGISVGRIQGAPAATTIEKTKADLKIVCNKEGYQEATYIEKSGLDGWVFGNILIGGLIGLGIDMASGSWNKYDSPVNVTLVQATAATVATPAPNNAGSSTAPAPGKPGM